MLFLPVAQDGEGDVVADTVVEHGIEYVRQLSDLVGFNGEQQVLVAKPSDRGGRVGKTCWTNTCMVSSPPSGNTRRRRPIFNPTHP